MVKISQIAFGKVDYTNTNQTTRVPKTAIQTFQPQQEKVDYTTVVREQRYPAEIALLNSKFEDIDAQEYVSEASTNGFRMLVVSDEDYNNFGAKWDNLT